MIVTKTKITLEMLDAVPLKKPANAGIYWRGIQHAKLVQAVIGAARAHQWQAKLDAAEMSNDKADLVASFGLDAIEFPMPVGFQPMIAIKNSNAKRWALSVTVGLRHTLRGTVLVLGRVPVASQGTKRGEDFNLSLHLFGAVGDAVELLRAGSRVAKTMTGEMDLKAMQNFLLDMGLKDLLSWKQVGAICERMASAKQPTAWTLICAISQQLDGVPVCARAKGQLEARLELCQQLEQTLTDERVKVA